MKTYELGGVFFNSKNAIVQHCKEILHGRAGNVNDHADFLVALLHWHTEHDQKVDVGIRRFFAAPSEYGTRCFHIERVDGTVTKWSYRACVWPPSQTTNALAGFREEIQDQIRAVFEEAFRTATNITCPLSGEPFGRDGAAVDHVAPNTLRSLVESFLHWYGVMIEEVRFAPTHDTSTSRRLDDRALADEWARFHRRHAVLRVISAKTHRSLPHRAPGIAKVQYP